MCPSALEHLVVFPSAIEKLGLRQKGPHQWVKNYNFNCMTFTSILIV